MVDAAYCYRRSSVVCLSSPVKMAEPIKMPFGMWTRVGTRNQVLNGIQIPLQRGNFERENGDPL